MVDGLSHFNQQNKQGCQDGSAGKNVCSQTQGPEFSPSKGEKEEEKVA